MDKKTRQKMLVARELLREGEHQKAYKIICAIDHPTARRWKKNMTRKYPGLLGKSMWERYRLPVLGILLMLLLAMMFAIVQDNITKDGHFEYQSSKMALEEYCLMQGGFSDCPEWAYQQLDTNRAFVDDCRSRHDVFSNWRAFGVCLTNR